MTRAPVPELEGAGSANLDGDVRMDLAAVLSAGGGLVVTFAGEDATWDVQRYESISGAAALGRGELRVRRRRHQPLLCTEK